MYGRENTLLYIVVTTVRVFSLTSNLQLNMEMTQSTHNSVNCYVDSAVCNFIASLN